jgi:hypothetical protein
MMSFGNLASQEGDAGDRKRPFLHALWQQRSMPAERYKVTVSINGWAAIFHVTACDAHSGPMDHMKM